jgi:hypothetical protein
MPIRKGKELYFGSRKVEGAWGHEKSFRAGEDGFPHSCWEKEGFVNGGLGLVILAEKPGGEAHLGIEIYGQDLSSHFRKGSGKGDHRCGLPNPTLLVGHREDRHDLPVYPKTVFPQLWLTVIRFLPSPLQEMPDFQFYQKTSFQ